MLTVTIPESNDLWDPVHEEFVTRKAVTLKLEHSLISLQLWESKWHKPFLESQKSNEELIDYIRCMTINKDIPDEAYYRIPGKILQEIVDYIQDPMTATKISEIPGAPSSKPRKKEVITAELIYYSMISCNIPSEYRKWHLNQLLTLIRVFDAKNQPEKKMSTAEYRSWQKSQNAARRAKMHSKG